MIHYYVAPGLGKPDLNTAINKGFEILSKETGISEEMIRTMARGNLMGTAGKPRKLDLLGKSINVGTMTSYRCALANALLSLYPENTGQDVWAIIGTKSYGNFRATLHHYRKMAAVVKSYQELENRIKKEIMKKI
jgi:hypothetical protein